MLRFRLGTSLFQLRRHYIFSGFVVLSFVATFVYFLPLIIIRPSLENSTMQSEYRKVDDLTLIGKQLDKLEKEVHKGQGMVSAMTKYIQNWLNNDLYAEKTVSTIKFKNHNDRNMAVNTLCYYRGHDIKCFPKKDEISPVKFFHDFDINIRNRTYKKLEVTDCSHCYTCGTPLSDENTFEIYKHIDFDNTDGGVWKQGWKIEYDSKTMWNENNKLKIFVVPHSHNDPGWIKTFEKYYTDQTQHILNNMVLKMKDDKRKKFIWAEISFFAHWWEKIDVQTKAIVRKLIADGQLEIVTGGWVMNDEATTHYFAMIEQMFVGHQWLQENLDFKPKNGWAIDPFGLSSTMPYLLGQMGLNNMVIQRVHYSIKKYLALRKRLEFVWHQEWDMYPTHGVFCHIMPFYSYDIPHTCGPDPKICCQFDFKRLPGNRVNCPWRMPPVAITTRNVAERARILLDQYRKKAVLFRSNVVMIQLGDDFRYDKASEWDQQFNNYQELFDYINSREDWHAEAQFGTLNDYFSALQKDKNVVDTNMTEVFPTLTGDFFTYADRDDHYWSGFFTTRPFYKNMDRALEAHLRGAEILFSLALAKVNEKILLSVTPIIYALMEDLVSATRALSLFQHHDAITGTSRDFVVEDYGKRMSEAFQKLRFIIGQCAVLLLSPHPLENMREQISVLQTDEYYHHTSMPTKKIINISHNKSVREIVLFNSIGFIRKELIKVKVSSPLVIVKDHLKNVVLSQVSPAFAKDNLDAGFELTFLAELQPLSLKTYSIHEVTFDELAIYGGSLSSVYVDPQENKSQDVAEPFNVFHIIRDDEIYMTTNFIHATFNGSTGMLKKISYLNSAKGWISMDVEIKFLKYGTKAKGKDKSGAYLFLPDGDAKEVEYAKPFIRIIEGPLTSELIVVLREVEHHVILKNSPGVDGIGVYFYNVINIASEYNKELIMRIVTNVYNHDLTFFTDLNGFQMKKRQYFSKLPLQANVYPITSIAYMEDDEKRFTFLTAHSVGVTCLKEGTFDIFLDRRLNQDDNRGLQQGITDNKNTPAHFQIFFEIADREINHDQSYPSLLAHHASLFHLHPVFILIHLEPDIDPDWGFRQPFNSFNATFNPMLSELPCNIHILNLKPLYYPSHYGFVPEDSSLLNLHHMGYDCSFGKIGNCVTKSNTLSIEEIFPGLFGGEAEETSLSMLYSGRKILRHQEFIVPHMEIVTFKLKNKQ